MWKDGDKYSWEEGVRCASIVGTRPFDVFRMESMVALGQQVHLLDIRHFGLVHHRLKLLVIARRRLRVDHRRERPKLGGEEPTLWEWGVEDKLRKRNQDECHGRELAGMQGYRRGRWERE